MGWFYKLHKLKSPKHFTYLKTLFQIDFNPEEERETLTDNTMTGATFIIKNRLV